MNPVLEPAIPDQSSRVADRLRRQSRWLYLGAGAACIFVFGTFSSPVLVRTHGGAWVVDQISHGLGINDRWVEAYGDVDVRAGHVRLTAMDGNFELEHGRTTSASRIIAYTNGTPTRTPVQIGGDDGQGVTALIVAGSSAKNQDLQQWTLDGTVAAAIDGKGNLRLGGIVIRAERVNGHVELAAVLPDGTRRVIAKP